MTIADEDGGDQDWDEVDEFDEGENVARLKNSRTHFRLLENSRLDFNDLFGVRKYWLHVFEGDLIEAV